MGGGEAFLYKKKMPPEKKKCGLEVHIRHAVCIFRGGGGERARTMMKCNNGQSKYLYLLK